eukprot:scaffold62381_cov24-Tisochrysis_lutea.AAC.6
MYSSSLTPGSPAGPCWSRFRSKVATSGRVPSSADPGKTRAKEPLEPRWPHDCSVPGGASRMRAASATPICTPRPNSAPSNILKRRGCFDC